MSMGLKLDKTFPVSKSKEAKLITKTKSCKIDKQQQEITKIHPSAIIVCFVTTVD